MPIRSISWRARTLPTPGHRQQQVDDPHLADDLVALALVEHVGDRGAGVLEAVLHLGALATGGGGLVEGGLALFGRERWESQGTSFVFSRVRGSAANLVSNRAERQRVPARSAPACRVSELQRGVADVEDLLLHVRQRLLGVGGAASSRRGRVRISAAVLGAEARPAAARGSYDAGSTPASSSAVCRAVTRATSSFHSR